MIRKISLVICVFMMIGVMVGCNDAVIKRDVIPKMLDNLEVDTQEAIENKDADQLRNIWSKISEYGVKAKKNGDTELATALGRLAASYSKAVLYVELKQDDLLVEFNKEFKYAVETVIKTVTVVKDNKTKS